jgi:PAS domain S-box-containing protein
MIATGTSRRDTKFKHKDGSARWWVVEGVKLSETRYLGFAKDISERYEMAENLRRHQRELEMRNTEMSFAKDMAETASIKFSELYELAPTCYFTISADDEILELNPSGARMLGKTRRALIGSRFGFFVSKDTLPQYNDFIRRTFSCQGKEIGEITITSEGNHSRYLHIVGLSMADGQKCQLNAIDLTERKMADQALKVSEEKYKTMLNASPDGILITDLQGTITDVSEIGIEILGCENREEIIGNRILRFIPSKEKTTVRKVIEKTMNEGIAQNVEIGIRKKNQSAFLGEVSATLIQKPGGEPFSFMVNIRDISRRKEMETKQMHADRMASLGEMAAGIAHEINQPLNTMSMVMDNVLFVAAREENLDKAYLRIKADKVFENITRIRNIIDHVRAFSRTQVNDLQTGFDINSSIINAISMISEQYKHLGIHLEIDLQENLPTVTGNIYKLEQVILNLFSNAKDALLEKKAKLSLSDDMTINIRSYMENHRLIIDVTDNGIGISNEDVKHIMLPFYTTKDAGKGTGLGLSISYQIIKDMNGTIEIPINQPGKTVLRIVLEL